MNFQVIDHKLEALVPHESRLTGLPCMAGLVGMRMLQGRRQRKHAGLDELGKEDAGPCSVSA